jgi:hypothetical protein
MSGFGSGLGGVHSDVLNANPTEQSAKDRLVDEIKNRAKGSLTTKNYPEAIKLYSKAIEIRPNDAILFANRSMCYLGMSKCDDALSDAEAAIEFDPSYVKGYYRKGMALVGLKKYSVARDALRKGLDLAPGDKSFTAQLDKLRGEAYIHDGTDVTSKSSTTTPLPKLPSKAKSTIQKDISKEKVKSSTSSAKVDSSMRGYKTTSDGRKTTFFNNELDEKTKELIGDITPKAISSTTTSQVSSNTTGSAWNTAGTFESVTHTPWAIERISNLLNGVSLIVPDGEGGGGGIITMENASLTGDAEITVNRGKRKHIYDFSASVDWRLEMEGDADDLKGSFSIEDVSGDREYDIVTKVSKKSRHTVTNHIFSKYIKSSASSGNLQYAIVQALDKFYDEFQQK